MTWRIGIRARARRDCYGEPVTTSPGEDDAGTANSRESAAPKRPAGRKPVAKRPAPKREVGKRPSRAAAPKLEPEAQVAAVDLLEPQEPAPVQDPPSPDDVEGLVQSPQVPDPESTVSDREPSILERATEVPDPGLDDQEEATDAPDPDPEAPDHAESAPQEDLLAQDVADPAVADPAVADPAVADPAPPVDAEPAPAPHVSATASAPALLLRGVSRSYGGSTAVAGIDLTVPAGSFYGLVGPNGAGKTTTMSMIAGLLRPDRGEIHVAGIDLARNPRAAKAMLGVLPDRLRTFDRLTGRQLLYYYGVLRGLKPAVVAQRTADLARAFDLTEALGRVVSDYSAGMTKKVMLAGAMIHSPRLLVLDEPFEAVDPVSSANILDILSSYVAHGGTVLLSSHGMDLIERVCTRVAVIVGGQLLAEGTVEEVRGEMTLEQRFVELSGEVSSMEGLEWLHTFSD